MKKVRIDVTQADIDAAHEIIKHDPKGYCNGQQCPVFRAAHRAIPTVYWARPSELLLDPGGAIKLPLMVVDKIHTFDWSRDRRMEPFSFEVEVPDAP